MVAFSKVCHWLLGAGVAPHFVEIGSADAAEVARLGG